MISYDRPTAPAQYFADPKIQTARTEIRKLVAKDPAGLLSDHFKDHWKAYRNYFSEAQGDGKCAYCESRIKPATRGDLDHFRPKTEIVKYSDQGQRKNNPKRTNRSRKGGTTTKPGYWWLAYSWNNWILACKSCNSYWKGCQFELNSVKYFDEINAIEEPLLLNAFDNQELDKHFRFDMEGDIIGNTPHGEYTIKCCGLDNWDLVGERARVIDRYVACLQDYVLARETNNEPLAASALRRIAEMCDKDSSYAGMVRHLVDSRNDFLFTWKEIIYMRDGYAI